MLKIGLIGAGFMGGMHAACYQALADEGVCVTAVADLRDEKAEAIAEKSGAVIYKTGFELIASADVDAIDICLPTYLHTEHAVAAMQKGLAVFIEKPVCLTESDMDLLIRTAKETKVPVMVGQCIRLWSEYAWLKKVIEEKRYGSLISGVFTRVSPSPTWSWENWLNNPQCSGTVATDMHVHDVDFVRYILGEPTKIAATAARDADGIIQQIFSTFEYDRAIVTVEACWDYPQAFPFEMSYRIKFDDASIVFSSTANPSLVVYTNDGEKIVPELEKEYEGENNIGGNLSSLGAYYTELKYFTHALVHDLPLEISPLDDAIESVRLVNREIEIAGGYGKDSRNV